MYIVIRKQIPIIPFSYQHIQIIIDEMDKRPFKQQYQDEEVRHFQQKTVLNKILILQSNCHQSIQLSVNIPYNSATRQLDLGRTLYQILKQIITAGHSYQVFYYCSYSQYFVFGGMYPFQDYLLLSQDFAALPVISVKIMRVHPPVINQIEVVSKKKRINDRNIKYVLQKVAQWRSNSENKNITLQQSAKQIDLPKKTLDDYFYQIKQGEYYGFNFQANLQQKIGVLRKFVKENHKKKPEEPLKILSQFMHTQEREEECDDSPGSQQEE